MLASYLSHHLGARLLGDDIDIQSIRRLDRAGPNDLSLLLAPGDRRRASSTKAGCLLLSNGDAADCADAMPCAMIVVDNPYLALQRAVDIIVPDDAPKKNPSEYFPFAYIGQALVGARTRIMPFVFVDDDVEVGEDCVIGAGSVLMSGTKIGNRVILQPGVVVGSDGFVYFPEGTRNEKLRSMAGVQIGDDVEIGAGSCVVRGLLEDTRIGARSKIDNLVQIGHDVQIGEDTLVVAQTGIAGHASIGHRATLGGQSGIAPHRRVGHDARISAATKVFSDVDDGDIASGSPAMPHMMFLRTSAAQKNLYDQQKEMRDLRKRVQQLENMLKVNHETR